MISDQFILKKSIIKKKKKSELLVISFLQRLDKKTQNFRYFVKDQKQHFTNFAKSRCTFSGVAHPHTYHNGLKSFIKKLYVLFMPARDFYGLFKPK